MGWQRHWPLQALHPLVTQAHTCQDIALLVARPFQLNGLLDGRFFLSQHRPDIGDLLPYDARDQHVLKIERDVAPCHHS